MISKRFKLKLSTPDFHFSNTHSLNYEFNPPQKFI